MEGTYTLLELLTLSPILAPKNTLNILEDDAFRARKLAVYLHNNTQKDLLVLLKKASLNDLKDMMEIKKSSLRRLSYNIMRKIKRILS